MFTGIVEEIGTVGAPRPGKLTVSAAKVLLGTRVGDSIAVNGACLTVNSVDTGSFCVDVMPETLRHTNLGSLHVGDRVNLERALLVGGRLGGHLVQGHIDATGNVVVSLTVAGYDETTFTVSLVAYTRENTTLGSRRSGDQVNLEVDVIAKYVDKLREGRGGITLSFLSEHGFSTAPSS
ncbi:MAG: riboflavin synthase [Chloroflexi bacterium]|nr:riboflavin synthase [Chloroflexota bacterium]